jgi:hypothetical protein
VGVASLPRGAAVEIDGIMYLGDREEAAAPTAAASAAAKP